MESPAGWRCFHIVQRVLDAYAIVLGKDFHQRCQGKRSRRGKIRLSGKVVPGHSRAGSEDAVRAFRQGGQLVFDVAGEGGMGCLRMTRPSIPEVI